MPPKQPKKSTKKPQSQQPVQEALPLEPAEKPVPETPKISVEPLALADRAARYNRHRSPLDDRPLVEQNPPAVDQKPDVQPARPLAPARVPVRVPQPRMQEAEKPAPTSEPKPRALDMAEIARRNRQVRDVAREEQPVAPRAPIPVPKRALPGHEPPVMQPKRDESMQERAARHNVLQREERLAEAKTPKPPMRQKIYQAVEKNEPDMVNRAADATKRRRATLGGPIVAAPVEELNVPPLLLPSTALVLVCRNDSARVTSRIQAWKQVLDAPDIHWWLVDLGSVDETMTLAEALHVRTLSVPGGLVQPLHTLDLVMRRVDAEVIAIVEAETYPDGTLLPLLQAVRSGQPIAVPQRYQPGMVVLAKKAWKRQNFDDVLDLNTWVKLLDRHHPQLPGEIPWRTLQSRFIARLLHASRGQQALQQVRKLGERGKQTLAHGRQLLEQTRRRLPL